MPGDDTLTPETAEPATLDTDSDHSLEGETSTDPAPEPELGSSSDEVVEPLADQQDGEPPQPEVDGSLTTGEEQPPQPEVDWQQRYNDIRRHNSRVEYQRRQDLQELQKLRDAQRQQQEAAEQKAIPRWSRQHPEYQQFDGLKSKIRGAQEALRNLPSDLPPEAADAAKAAILSGISADDQDAWMQYQQQREQFAEQFFEDPYSMLQPLVEQVAQQTFSSIEQRNQASARVDQDFQDPQVQAVIQEHGPEFAQALQDGVPYEYAVHMARMFQSHQSLQDEIKGLRGQVETASTEVSQSRERDRLLRGKASITRDVATDTSTDPYQAAVSEATERGIPLDSRQFISLLERHQQGK